MKDIYDEGIKELQDYINEYGMDYYGTKHYPVTIKALERAKKVEKLVELFKQLSVVNYNMAITQGSENYYENKRAILIKKIKASEEELK